MNLLLKKLFKKNYCMKDKINTNRSEHKKKLKESKVFEIGKTT